MEVLIVKFKDTFPLVSFTFVMFADIQKPLPPVSGVLKFTVPKAGSALASLIAQLLASINPEKIINTDSITIVILYDTPFRSMTSPFFLIFRYNNCVA